MTPGIPFTSPRASDYREVDPSNAQSAGNAADFLQRTAAELCKVRRLLLKDAFWLPERKISAAMAPMLGEFRVPGGAIDHV